MLLAHPNRLRVPGREQVVSFYPGPHSLAIMKEEELKTGAQIDTCLQMPGRALFIIDGLKTKCPSTDNDVLTQATPRMKLKNIVLSKRSQYTTSVHLYEIPR